VGRKIIDGINKFTSSSVVCRQIILSMIVDHFLGENDPCLRAYDASNCQRSWKAFPENMIHKITAYGTDRVPCLFLTPVSLSLSLSLSLSGFFPMSSTPQTYISTERCWQQKEREREGEKMYYKYPEGVWESERKRAQERISGIRKGASNKSVLWVKWATGTYTQLSRL